MTYDEAADLMVRELHFPRAQACGDLNWYSQSPSVPMGYALGWSIINRLRDQEQKRLGRQIQPARIPRQTAQRRQHLVAAGRKTTFHAMTEDDLNVLNDLNGLNQGRVVDSFKQFKSFKPFKTL